MSTQTIRLRPTKVELIRLKRRNDLAKRVHKILKERLTILVSELLSLARDAITKRYSLNNELQEAYKELIIAYGQIGEITLAADSTATQRNIEIEFLTQNIVGVKAPLIETSPILRLPGARGLTLFDESLPLQKASEHFEKSVELVIELAEIEKSVELVGLEVKVMRRKVNILEHNIIPAMEEMINYLSMKFEEREREEKSRLKRIKDALIEGRMI